MAYVGRNGPRICLLGHQALSSAPGGSNQVVVPKEIRSLLFPPTNTGPAPHLRSRAIKKNNLFNRDSAIEHKQGEKQMEKEKQSPH